MLTVNRKKNNRDRLGDSRRRSRRKQGRRGWIPACPVAAAIGVLMLAMVIVCWKIDRGKEVKRIERLALRMETGIETEDDEASSQSGETEAATETETETQTEASSVLANLSGLAPGTILAEEQIDFSNLDAYFMSWVIEEGDNLYERINGKSYQANDYVPLCSLRYLKMPHYNFDGQIQVGEMIVNKDIEEDVKNIFKELFEAKYQIYSMYLIDHYWTGDGDSSDSASIEVNNTSAFCYRTVTGGKKLSNHAYGKAIDLNPQQNPYVSYSTGSPRWYHENASDYIDRNTGRPHMITHDDLAYQIFIKYGFQWGGDWNNPKDYQHFDKNLPSQD